MSSCRWPGGLNVTNGVPCGPTNSTTPIVPCCEAGDQCMTDNICHYTKSRAGGSGYYTAGCSADEPGAFTDKLCTACENRCAQQPYPDITYDREAELWYCCGSGKAKGSHGCDNSTNIAISAAAPESLISYGPDLNADTPSSGLSTGAKAGIGVGVGVGALIIIAAAAFLFLRRRKRNTPVAPQEETVETKPDSAPAYDPNHPAELDQDGPGIQELPSERQSVIQELPADNWAK